MSDENWGTFRNYAGRMLRFALVMNRFWHFMNIL